VNINDNPQAESSADRLCYFLVCYSSRAFVRFSWPLYLENRTFSSFFAKEGTAQAENLPG
jgi:hypothetical protein